MSLTAKPAAGEFPPYFSLYIDKVPATDLVQFLVEQRNTFLRELNAISEPQSPFRYATGKWSVKEILGHICDTERIFAYRLLRIARGDQKPLAGFDQDAYVANAASDAVPWSELMAEFSVIREATVALLRHLPHEAWTRLGIANDHAISVSALGYMMAGHVEHHRGLLSQHPPPGA